MPSTLMPKHAILLIGLAFFAGCAEQAPTAPDDSAQLSFNSGPVLVECPTNVTKSVSGLITPLGGSLNVDGTKISLPFGAVLLPTSITLTVPASNYMEVEITANGTEHFQFEAPVTVTISYARCTRTDINRKTLTAWYIDSSTKALLENMNGVDNKLARTVTFTTDHLSGYSIAE